MAQLLLSSVVLLLAGAGAAAPARQVLSTFLGAECNNFPDSKADSPLQSASPRPVTITDMGDNFLVCLSQVQATAVQYSSPPIITPPRGTAGSSPITISSAFTTTNRSISALGSTRSATSAVQSSSPNLCSPNRPYCRSTAGRALTATAMTTNAQGGNVTELIVVTSLSTSIASCLPLPAHNNTGVTAASTIQKTQAKGSFVSESADMSVDTTSFLSSLPLAKQSGPTNRTSLVTGSEEITSTCQSTNAQGALISEIPAIGPSTTQSVSLFGSFGPSEFSTTPKPALKVTSTETTLPPGASIQTLSSGAYLSDQWITTTEPGSSSTTVIPIILPSNGRPPIALWGFLPGPPDLGDLPTPPALEINIPMLHIPCITFLGMSIGGCPSNNNNNNNPTGPVTDSPSTITSESQSCSSTTATITNVLCSPSGSAISCITQKTRNVGCSLSGSAITSGSCAASTKLGSSTACCSSVSVSVGSTVCAFTSMTLWDLNMGLVPYQSQIEPVELMSELSAYMASMTASPSREANSTGVLLTGATSGSASFSAVNSRNIASSIGPMTFQSPPSTSSTPIRDVRNTSAAPAITNSPLCVANGERGICVCSIGTIIQTISSYLNPSSNICGYTTLPSTTASSTPPIPRSRHTGYIYTITDPNFGWIIECTSVNVRIIAGLPITECAGGITTASTVSSIAAADSGYRASAKAASSASVASVALAASAAAASPTARVLITYYTYENEDVFVYQYRVYDGSAPNQQIDYCLTSSPIAFVTLDDGTGDPTDLPTDQLPTFTTHGIDGCMYQSQSSNLAGTLSCPGWATPVRCDSVVGSDAQEFQCPTAEGATEQRPIVNCSWGADP